MSATSSSAVRETPAADGTGRPWWRVPAMWFVVGGPATVVVTGVITAVIAVSGADVPLIERSRPSAAADAPAVQARNHAATHVAAPAR